MPIEDGGSLQEMAEIEQSESGSDEQTLLPENETNDEVVNETDDTGDDETEDPGDGGDEPEDGDSPLAKRGLMQWFESNYGLDLSKYSDDASGLHGIANAMKLVGQRDEDAQWAAQLKPYKEQIEALVSGKKEESTEPVSDEPEFNEAWELLIQKGNASPDIVEKYNKHVTWERNKLRELINDPEKALGSLLEKKLGGRVSEIEQKASQITSTLEQQKQAAAMDSWVGQHAADIYVDGDTRGELTVLGKRAAEIYNDQFLQALPQMLSSNSELAMSELALRLAKAETPKPNKTRKVPAAAVRKPNLASGGGDKTPVDSAVDKIDAGASLADVLLELSKT